MKHEVLQPCCYWKGNSIVSLDPKELVESVIVMAELAGEKILPYFGLTQDEMGVRSKEDNSPLTSADMDAHELVLKGLRQLTPDLPVLSEESKPKSYAIRQQWSSYWLVDPLDGTRGFISGSKEFTVNIALIDNGRPVLGVIYWPCSRRVYYAAVGVGSFKKNSNAPSEKIITAKMDWEKYRVVLGRFLSKSRLLSIYQQEENCEILRRNSSLKFCLLAEGRVDIYPRLGPTGEWDTAAGQCIVEQAGGLVVDLEDQPLRYNTKESLINPAFIAIGDVSQRQQIIQFIQEKRRNS